MAKTWIHVLIGIQSQEQSVKWSKAVRDTDVTAVVVQYLPTKACALNGIRCVSELSWNFGCFLTLVFLLQATACCTTSAWRRSSRGSSSSLPVSVLEDAKLFGRTCYFPHQGTTCLHRSEKLIIKYSTLFSSLAHLRVVGTKLRGNDPHF
jgi:hypothetical protein